MKRCASALLRRMVAVSASLAVAVAMCLGGHAAESTPRSDAPLLFPPEAPLLTPDSGPRLTMPGELAEPGPLPMPEQPLPVPASILGSKLQQPVGSAFGSAADVQSQAFSVEVTIERSAQLENVARQADQRTRHGCELAGRKAYFAARAEFIAALRLVSGGLDAEGGNARHSQELAAALAALGEADDFLPRGSQMEADLDLRGIIGSHRTPVLKATDSARLTPLMALRSYLTFAQEQFAASIGNEVAGSIALVQLGKLHMAMASEKTAIRAAESKAVACLQGALLAWPQNHLAANELGVLLCRGGDPVAARGALEYSLAIYPQPAVWRNLAVVYRQLGENQLAGQAELASRRAAASTRQGPAGQMVEWVDPRVFNPQGAAAQATAAQPVRRN